MSGDPQASADGAHGEPPETGAPPPLGTGGTGPDVRIAWPVRITAIFLIAVTTIAGHLPPAKAVLFISMVPAGGFLWKIPPFEIGPRPGLRYGFLRATIDRGREALLATATWAGVGAAFGALVGALASELGRGGLTETTGIGATWGTLVCGVLGASVWTARRTVADRRVLVERMAREPRAEG
jgi:hypothetical protein